MFAEIREMSSLLAGCQFIDNRDVPAPGGCPSRCAGNQWVDKARLRQFETCLSKNWQNVDASGQVETLIHIDSLESAERVDE
jgi:hypothetical protein